MANTRKDKYFIDLENTKTGAAAPIVITNFYSVCFYLRYFGEDMETAEKIASWAKYKGLPGQVKEGNGWRMEIKRIIKN